MAKSVIKVSVSIDAPAMEQHLTSAEFYAIGVLLSHQEIVPAIKFYRESNKIGLREAKDTVDYIRDHQATIADSLSASDGSIYLQIPTKTWNHYEFMDYDCYALQMFTNRTVSVEYLQKRFEIEDYANAAELLNKAEIAGVMRY